MKLLSPFGWLYGLGADARNALYDRGLFRVHDLGARTISIGNITAGGTGKTPVVAVVAKTLADAGEKVCILTRGYGRKNAGERVLVSDGETVFATAEKGGDEPVELANKLIGKSIIVADADRVSAAAWAREKFGVTAFVLDDGFQHRRAKRDLDILCIDATDPFGGSAVLPAGTLRERLRNLARADACIITRAGLVDSTDELTARVRKLNPQAPIFLAESQVSRVEKLDDFLTGEADSKHVDSEPVPFGFLFCALGNPAGLRKQLSCEGFHLNGFRDFPDHHFYTQADIDGVEAEAKKAGAASLLTTAKDAVKLAGLRIEMPCLVIESSLKISDRERFDALVKGN
jgi:tetraacyldisaccharide 4'-kinase